MKLLRSRRESLGRGRVTRRPSRRGQSTVELALVLPLLIILLSVIIEAGLALNSWMRVNTAARDAVRFSLDAGRPSDTATLVLNKLVGMDRNQITVYIVRGKTDANGDISNWVEDRRWGSGSLRVKRGDIQARLADPANPNANKNMTFTIVEVDYNYSPLLATLVARNSFIPMTSYAIVQQY